MNLYYCLCSNFIYIYEVAQRHRLAWKRFTLKMQKRALLRTFYRNNFEIVVSVIINCTSPPKKNPDSITYGLKGKVWGRLWQEEGGQREKEE